MNRRIEILLLVTLVTTYFVWFAWPIVWTASENLRLISVFSAEEAHHLRIIRDAIIQRNPKIEFGNYGHLYFNVTLLPLLLLSFFTRVTEQQIIVTLRLIPTLFSVATIGATFFLVRRYFGRLAAWLAALLLSIVPWKFLQYSVISLPDIPQLFFLVLGIYFCCRFFEEDHPKWMLWASTSAGLAFASKYSGIFLLPIIWMILAVHMIRSDSSQIKINTVQLATVFRYVAASVGIVCVVAGIIITPEFIGGALAADGRIDDALQVQFLNSMRVNVIFIGCGLMLLAVLRFIWSTIGQMPKLVTALKGITLSCATFGVVFFLVSPFSFYRLHFLQGIYFESRHIAFGHLFKASSSGLLWFNVLMSPQVLDIFILGLAALGLILNAYKVSRKGWRDPIVGAESTMWAWVIFYMSFIFLRVNMRSPNYLLPVTPFLIILSTRPVSQALEYVAGKRSRKLVTVLAFAILFIIGCAELPKSLTRLYKKRQVIISREYTSTSVKAGKWLAENYPASTRILFDYYSYVPPSFLDARDTWGGTIEILEELKPNIVIVNKSISDRFSDIRQATRYAEGEEEFIERHEYYKAMREETAGYTLIRDFGHIQIYARITT